ncbi:hypothetical protein BGZ91_007439, partial [Linnemannia elongata]
KATTKNGRGGEKQQAKDGVMKPARRLGCRGKFTAFSGISRPLTNGVDGADGTDGTGTKSMKKVGVTLIVYEYEHNHDIRHLMTTNKETDRSRDLRLSREKREELARHIKVLLARGFEIREVAQMLGANAKRCRELHMRGGNGSKGRRFGWKEYLTRSDVVKALELLQRIEAWGTQRSLDKESQVGEAEEESKEVAEMKEGEPAVEEKESKREVEKALEVDVDDDKVEEVSKEQWQMDILRKALKDLYCLKETSGLDPELDEDDPRLHGLGSSTDTNGQQRGSHIYTHPHLEVFRDIRSKQRAQHNFNLIMDSLTTNYFIYSAWTLLGFNLPSSTRSAGGVGTARESQDIFGGGGGCKAQITVYVGISKPLARSLGGGNGRMVDVALILKRLISSGCGSGGVKDAEVGVRTGEEQQQDVIENKCQEVEQEAEDDDEEYYFTLDDISICPFPLPAYKAYETGPVETREQERRQQQEQEQELRTTIDLESSSLVRGGGNDPLSALKRYRDEWDNSEFAACNDKVEEMVDSLKVIKPLSGPVSSTAGGSNGSRGSEDGPQGVKRRRG